MKKSSVFAAVLGALVAGTLCTGLSASAIFRLPADMEDADYSTLPNTQTGIIYTNDAVYAGEATHTGLIVVLQPGASFPEEILAQQTDKMKYEEMRIAAPKYPWMGFLDQYLPYYEAASSFHEGEFERYFDAWRLSADESDVCGTIYRDKLCDYDLSQCWMMVPCLLNGQPLYNNTLAWNDLCFRLEDSPAVQGIYMVGYTKTEQVAPTGSFYVYTTAEDDLKIEEIKELKLANYPDFQIDEIAMPDRVNFYNDEYYLNVSGLDENDTVGYHTAWTAINDWLQERTAEDQISICEMDTESMDAQPSFTPFLNTFYETLSPSVKVPLRAYAGDANGDNRISVADVVLLSRYVAQDEDLLPAQTAAILRNGQCDNDRELNAGDTAMLSRCIAGLVPQKELGPFGGKDYSGMPFSIMQHDLAYEAAMTFGFLANNQEYWFGSDCLSGITLVFENGDEVSFSDALRYGLVPTEQLVQVYPNATLYQKPIGSEMSKLKKVEFVDDADQTTPNTDYSKNGFYLAEIEPDSAYDDVMTLAFTCGETEYWLSCDCISNLQLVFENGDKIALSDAIAKQLVPTEQLIVSYPNVTLYKKPVGSEMSALKKVNFEEDAQVAPKTDYSAMAFQVEEMQENVPYGDMMTLAFTCGEKDYWLSCDCISNLQLVFENGDKIALSDVLTKQLVPTERLIVPYPNVTLYEKPVGSMADDYKKVTFEAE